MSKPGMGAIYLDTSAAMKLVRSEQHSAELSKWLAARTDLRVLSSVLIKIELPRATRRNAAARMGRAAEVLAGITTIALSAAVVSRAARYSDGALRSLDAIHLASAEDFTASAATTLHAFVAYDDRLLAAARNLGLSTVTPGVD